jgi:hypothetical protein
MPRGQRAIAIIAATSGSSTTRSRTRSSAAPGRATPRGGPFIDDW